MKKQNPIAKELRTPKYKPRVVKDKTKYDRKTSKRKHDVNIFTGSGTFSTYKGSTFEGE